MLFSVLLSCDPNIHQLNWVVEFESDDLREQAHIVEATLLRSGCDGVEIQSWNCENDESCPDSGENDAWGCKNKTVCTFSGDLGQEIDTVHEGAYGFAARARNADCQWYAKGCQQVSLSADTGTVTTLLKGSPLHSICRTDQQCINGECSGISTDADVGPDAGPDTDLDADPDEETIVDPCDGACGSCEDCIDKTCAMKENSVPCSGEEGFCVRRDHSLDKTIPFTIGCCTAILDERPEGVIIDEHDPCGSHSGVYHSVRDKSDGYWRLHNSGYNDNSWWTKATTWDTGHLAEATWYFSVRTPGSYKLEAFIPSHTNFSEKVIYRVDSRVNVEEFGPISHGVNNDWVNVGTLSLPSGEQFTVKIGDNTGENRDDDRYISFDAIRFTYQGPSQ